MFTFWLFNFIIFAGFPIITALFGIFLHMNEFAEIVTLFPIVIFPTITVPVPIVTSFPIIGFSFLIKFFAPITTCG